MFKEKLKTIRNGLSSKLIPSDSKSLNIKLMGEILNLTGELKTILEKEKIQSFSKAADLMTNIISKAIFEEVGYHAGMTYASNFFELFNNAIETFLNCGSLPTEFEDAVFSMDHMLNSSDANNKKSDTDNEYDKIIQTVSNDFGDDSLVDFISETEDALNRTGATLLQLDKNPKDMEKIAEVFRFLHTVKGASSMFGLDIMSIVAHQAEDILSKVQSKKIEFNHNVSKNLTQSLDVLQELNDQLKQIIVGEKPEPVSVKKVINLHENNLKKDSMNSDKEAIQTDRKPLIGEFLVKTGQVTQKQVNEALEEQQKPLGEILVDKGAITQQGIENALKQMGDRHDASHLTDMIRVHAYKLDELLEDIGEMVVALSILSQRLSVVSIADRETSERLDQLNKITEHLHDKILGIRMLPVSSVFSKMERQVRDLSQKCHKKVNITIEGKETLVDKTVIDGIYAPLMHLVRNAIDHGIEDEEERRLAGKSPEGNLNLGAYHIGDAVLIAVSDDGRGVQRDMIIAKAIERGLIKKGDNLSDEQIFSFIFQSGFSTAKKVTDVSGRGVGMDAVKKDVERLRGKISMSSVNKKGTTFSIKLPLTTSIIEGLIVKVGPYRFVIPILEISQIANPKRDLLQDITGIKDICCLTSGEFVSIIRLHQFFDVQSEIADASQAIIIVIKEGNKKYGLLVDELLNRQQVVIKNLGEQFQHLHGIIGGTILGDGHIGFILDPLALINHR